MARMAKEKPAFFSLSQVRPLFVLRAACKVSWGVTVPAAESLHQAADTE